MTCSADAAEAGHDDDQQQQERQQEQPQPKESESSTHDCASDSVREAVSDNYTNDANDNDGTNGHHPTSCTGSSNKHADASYAYEITGTAAHSRIAPLLPSHWVDVAATTTASTSPSSSSSSSSSSRTTSNTTPSKVSFLWSNAPRHATKSYRDHVMAYSHLPAGTSILDDKWVLARLLGRTSSTSSSSSATCNSKDDSGDGDGGGGGDGNGNGDGYRGLETHCFRGPDGFAKFCSRVAMFESSSASSAASASSSITDEADAATNTAPTECGSGHSGSGSGSGNSRYAFSDLMDPNTARGRTPPPEPTNLWVVKDAQSNGAGGIWVVDPTNASAFLPPAVNKTNDSDGAGRNDNANTTTNTTPRPTATPLVANHRYVAQRYAWPPMLYRGRKFHIRVYGLITSDGRAYVHRRCFLHVANERFEYDGTSTKDKGDGTAAAALPALDSSVHITNCCANSHNEAKFAGEICADLGTMAAGEAIANADADTDADTGNNYSDGEEDAVALGEYLASISQTVATLTRKSMPYLTGGRSNGGFEYLGLDFILSTEPIKPSPSSDIDVDVDIDIDGPPTTIALRPTAHLLEVNAPPSQDTATGLLHAERLHDTVLRDLLTLWVVPKVDASATSQPGGWMCVYNDNDTNIAGGEEESSDILPSKAAILNKMRWAIHEWKMAKLYEEEGQKLMAERLQCSADEKSLHHAALLDFVRQSFPYYSDSSQETIFLENAGGAQVPASVVRAMSASLSSRHRACEGSRAKLAARNTLLSILGASSDTHHMFLGTNATSLLDCLARRFIESSFIGKGDEIIICTENHSANIIPWTRAASTVGAHIVWWTWKKNAPMDNVSDLVTDKTRIVAMSHASNIIGDVRDIKSICKSVEEKAKGSAHVVVDGVAAAPHVSPALSQSGAHWYLVSCHKLFGPHLGGLCGLKSAADCLLNATGTGDGNATDIHADGRNGDDELLYKSFFELGTLNFEACAGVGCGLKDYFLSLSNFDSTAAVRDQFTATFVGTSKKNAARLAPSGSEQTSHESTEEARSGDAVPLLPEQIGTAYHRIGELERGLCTHLLEWLRRLPQVVVIERVDSSADRIPIISFFHRRITSDVIARTCLDNGIVCRSDTFLAGSSLLSELSAFGLNGNLVRLSFAHYNTKHEADRVLHVLKTIDGWL